MAGDYTLGQMMEVLDVKIGSFVERSSIEVTAPITITPKIDWGNLTGVGGQNAGEIWTHSFIGEFQWDDNARPPRCVEVFRSSEMRFSIVEAVTPKKLPGCNAAFGNFLSR